MLHQLRERAKGGRASIRAGVPEPDTFLLQLLKAGVGPSRQMVRWNLISAFGVLRKWPQHCTGDKVDAARGHEPSYMLPFYSGLRRFGLMTRKRLSPAALG